MLSKYRSLEEFLYANAFTLLRGENQFNFC